MLDLSELQPERIFIIGEILGDHTQFIRLLYEQHFNYKDIMVTTGNNFDFDDPKSIETLLFIKNSLNVYSVKGKNEVDLIDQSKTDPESIPTWLRSYPTTSDILKFIIELPLIIKISEYIYIVHAGVLPNKTIDEQDPKTFYMIGDFDKDSEFYQFENPDEKSWYDFDIFKGDKRIEIYFGGKGIGKVKVPAGYCLGREKGQTLKGIIIPYLQSEMSPIYVEV